MVAEGLDMLMNVLDRRVFTDFDCLHEKWVFEIFGRSWGSYWRSTRRIDSKRDSGTLQINDISDSRSVFQSRLSTA